MACYRCLHRPLLVDAEGRATELVPGGIDWRLLDRSLDPVVFTIAPLHPPGYLPARVCSLCCGVYFPRRDEPAAVTAPGSSTP